jgi:hypothetical protein
MAILTLAQLQTLDLGYISGQNLIQFCPAPLLLQQTAVGIDFDLSLSMAKTDIISKLSNQYDFTAEYKKVFPVAVGTPPVMPADTREPLVLQLTILLTIRNVLASGAMNLDVKENIDRGDKKIEEIIKRLRKLDMPIAVRSELANSRLIHSRFHSETDRPGWANRPT